MMTKIIRSLVSLFLVMSAAGCAATGASAAAEPYLEVSGATAATQPLGAAEAWPTRRGTDRFLLLDDHQPAGEIDHEQAAAERFDAEWRLAEGDVREQYYAVDDDGNIVLRAVIEHEDKAISLFNPPLISVYERIAPGESRSQQVKMRVVQRDDPQKVRDRGSATQTIAYREDCRVRLGDRSFPAVRIDLSFEADLGLADVHHESTMYIVRGFGMIAEQSEKTIRIFGLIPDTERRVQVIAPQSAPDVEPASTSGGTTP